MCTVSDGVSINNLVFDRSDIFVLYSKWPTMRWVKAFEGSESLFICSIEVDSSCDRIHSMDDFERCLDPVRCQKFEAKVNVDISETSSDMIFMPGDAGEEPSGFKPGGGPVKRRF
jgi:hypothetical protein